MKVSIITVCYNSEKFIKYAIESVINQTYKNIEYIIIDGNSTDNTKEIIKSYASAISIFKSEKDNGIYDAMNKGIALASGDLISILNSDDFYYSPNVISQIVSFFNSNPDIDASYGNLEVVNRENPDFVVRNYLSSDFTPSKMKYGIMPGHATFFINKNVYNNFGNYNTNYRIAADFDFLLRTIIKNNIKVLYNPIMVIKARTGGLSDNGILSKIKISFELSRICKDNKFKTNFLFLNFRLLYKIKQMFFKN